MEPLPQEFLRSIAAEYRLSADLTETLVKRLEYWDNEIQAAEALHISESTLSGRMTKVYDKFSIGASGPGKLRKLHDSLSAKYRQRSGATPAIHASDIDAFELVQQVRQQVKADIHERCGMMRVLDMEQKIGIGDIYTRVNILEKLSGRRRISKDQLLAECDRENFDRFLLGQIKQERVPGLEAVERHSRLMILGKPGAGKTTFMKRMATLCNQGEWQRKLVPVFVTLKEFAEASEGPTLQQYIAEQWQRCEISQSDWLGQILKKGLALILLDGLDEVQETEHGRVIREVQSFTRQFRDCQYVMTCRIAAEDYTFQQFTEVEIADFDKDQIADFVTKWFSIKQDSTKAETFIYQLEANEALRELTTNPLLLTLLCLAFGGVSDFPSNRAELYEEVLDVLLKKWDSSDGIERKQIYRKLSLGRKKELLSQLAFLNFEQGEYFFKQSTLEQQITDYIHSLPEIEEDEKVLHLDAEAVLRSIEAQHGLLVSRAKRIYSFSHLTFQEYFTAKYITCCQAQPSDMQRQLVTHLSENRYREIFLLSVGMLPEADGLLFLIKQAVDGIIGDDCQLQEFLVWIWEKADSADHVYSPAALRAFHLGLALKLFDPFKLPRALDVNLASGLGFATNIALSLQILIKFELAQDLARSLEHALSIDLSFIKDSAPKLRILRDRLPSPENWPSYQQWWLQNGQTWTESLHAVVLEYPHIGHSFQFTDAQKQKLRQYYDANKLLVDCLNSDCYVTKATRQEIEDTLLLPLAEIQKREISISR